MKNFFGSLWKNRFYVVTYILVAIAVVGFTFAAITMFTAIHDANKERFEMKYLAAACKNPYGNVELYALEDWTLDDGMVYINTSAGNLYIYDASNCYIVGADSVDNAA